MENEKDPYLNKAEITDDEKEVEDTNTIPAELMKIMPGDGVLWIEGLKKHL